MGSVVQTDDSISVGGCLSPTGHAKWYLETLSVAQALASPS